MAMNTAVLNIVATKLVKGDYQPIASDVMWQLSSETAHLADDASEYLCNEPKAFFEIPAGSYRLTVKHANLSADVTGIDLKPGEILHEVIVLTDQKMGGEHHQSLLDEAQFNALSEYQRREIEREGQRTFGVAARALVLQEKGNGMGQGFMAHPLLAQSAQFDGMPPKLDPQSDQNQHAAENANDLTLHPNPQLQAQATHGMSGPSPTPFNQ